MTGPDDYEGPPPYGAWKRLADVRAEWLAETEADLRLWMVAECRLRGDELERYVAYAMAKCADVFDARVAAMRSRLH